MAETKIEWTARPNPKTGELIPGFTANFWMGCTKIAPECANCYAATQDTLRKWTPEGWGPGKPRKKGKMALVEPFKWHKQALKIGTPLAVFTNSLADFFDKEVPDDWRMEALRVIIQTHALDWLVLTKRPAYAAEFFQERPQLANLSNAWLGTTVGHTLSLERAQALIEVPAVRRFLSMEPLLDDVAADPRLEEILASGKIHWVIVGGESGTGARPMFPEWPERIRDLCAAYGVPFYFKQWGEWAPLSALDHNPEAQAACVSRKVEAYDLGTGDAPLRYAYKVGKAVAGRTLGGKTWSELPAIRSLTAPPPQA